MLFSAAYVGLNLLADMVAIAARRVCALSR
jgi:hypothetical protein